MLQQVRVGGCSFVGNGRVRGMVIDVAPLLGGTTGQNPAYRPSAHTYPKGTRDFQNSELENASFRPLVASVGRYGVDSGASNDRTRNLEIMRTYQGICSAAQENTKWLSQPRSRSV